MQSIRVFLFKNGSYETFDILEIDKFFEKLKADPRISNKYKKMNIAQFIEWIDRGVTPKQYAKLNHLNSH